MTEFLKKLRIKRIGTEDAADITGVQTAVPQSRESIDIKQILQRRSTRTRTPAFLAAKGIVRGMWGSTPVLL